MFTNRKEWSIVNWKIQSQNNSLINACCFEGGGIRGLVYVGVAKALEEKKFHCKRFIGSSAGSIFASLLACGATSDYLEKIVKSTNFNLFKDSRWYYIGECYNFSNDWGVYSGDYFYNWYSCLLKELTGNEAITFKDLYTYLGVELVITGSNISLRKMEYFNCEKFPNMEIRLAVRISMSIPFFFKPVNYLGYYWVDGGYLNNFPMGYFNERSESRSDYANKMSEEKMEIDSPSEARTNEMSPNETSKIIGFKLVGNRPKEYVINNWSSFITNLLESATESLEELESINDNSSISIPTFDIQPTDFGISSQNIDLLIRSGYTSVMNSGLI